MLTIDIILLAIILLFGIIGLFRGFIKSIGRIVGLILSFVFATKLYGIISSILPSSITNQATRNLIGIIVMFLILAIISGLIVELLSKLFKLPVIDIVNRVLGFAFGAIEAILVLGFIFMFITQYAIIYNPIKDFVANSFMIPFLVRCVNIVTPLLPDFLKGVEETAPTTTIPTSI